MTKKEKAERTRLWVAIYKEQNSARSKSDIFKGTKRCPRCDFLLEKCDFTLCLGNKDGLNHKCKNCSRELDRIRYPKESEKRKAAASGYAKGNPAKVKAYQVEYAKVHAKEAVARAARWVADNPERSRKYRREYAREKLAGNPVYLERRKKYDEKYNLKPAVKRRREANRILRAAIKGGEATKRGICETCLSTERVACHHEDYSRPLEFVELCSLCHGALHRRYRAAGRILQNI